MYIPLNMSTVMSKIQTLAREADAEICHDFESGYFSLES